MTYPKQNCFSEFSKTSSLTDNTVDNYRFSNENPKSSDFVCMDHLDTADDLSGIDESTTIFPTFNPEFIEIKQEFDDSNQNFLDVADVKYEIENYNANENSNFVTYEIFGVPTASDDDIMSMTNRIKIEEDPLNTFSGNEEEPIEQKLDINSKIQSIGEKISVAKISKLDHSKVSLKVVSVPNEQGSKMAVKTVEKSSQDQTKSCFSGKPVLESQSKLNYSTQPVNKVVAKSDQQALSTLTNSVKTVLEPKTKSLDSQSKLIYGAKHAIKSDSKSVEDKPKSTNFPETETPTVVGMFVDRDGWKDDETQGLLKYMLLHKDEFKNLPRAKQHKFWQKMEIILKKQGVLRHPTNSIKIYNKWKALKGMYKCLALCNKDMLKYPFMNDVKKILFDTVVPGRVLQHDTQTFLKYILDHRDEFCSNGLKKVYWKTIEVDIQTQGVMTQAATADQLRLKWKLLIKNYKSDKFFNKMEPNKLAYIKEMKYILLDPLRPHKRSISIGLTSPVNTPINSPSTSNFQMKNAKSSKMEVTLKSNNANSLSISELKKIYLQKKIEGRELKSKLLMTLFNEPNSSILTNKFKLVKIDKINKSNNQE